MKDSGFQFKAYIFVLANFLLIISDSFCQNTFKNFNPSNEKTGAAVRALLQDSNGYLWLGSSGGLIRYNGIDFKKYLREDSLSDNDISAFYMSGKDSIWLGYSNGQIAVFNTAGEKFENFNPDEGLPAQKITAIQKDSEGKIWFATYGEGIYFYDGTRIHSINSDDGLSDNSVYTIFIDKNGQIWAGTDGGISIINPHENDKSKQLKKLSMKDGLPDNIVKFISQDETSILIAMQDSGVCRYFPEQKRFDNSFFPGVWNYGSVSSFAMDKMGALWIGTSQNGLIQYFLHSGDVRFYNHKNGLASNAVFTVMEDREHTIWVGSSSGISQYNYSRFEFLNQKDGLLSNNIYAFFTDSKGNYWIGSDVGLTRYSISSMGKTEVKNYTVKNGISHQQVVSIFEDVTGNIWLGTYGGGVCKLNPSTEKIQIYSEKNGLANNNVMSIAADKNGNIWFATLGGVSRISSDGLIKNFFAKDGIGSDYAYFVFNDSKNNIWLATDGGGIVKYDGTNFKTYGKNEGLGSETVFSIDEDKNGNIWLSAADAGIYKYDGLLGEHEGSFQNYNSKNGLRDDSPSVLICDHQNNVIIAHKSGIDKYNSISNTFQYFGADEGLTSFEPNLNAVHKQKDGIIWLGTTNGAVKYNTSESLNNLVEPLTKITRLRVLTEDMQLNSEPTFQHNQNNITFDFIGLSLTNPQKVRYRIMLENFDKDWSAEMQATTFNYPYLPPGNYKFLVKACNNDGLWNKIPASYEFTIKPPFWLTWWFWTFTISFVFGSAYFYTKWKTRKIESEKKILEQKVQDRTKEIMMQKQIIEEKSKNITDSINYAKKIQQAILPPTETIYKTLPDSFVLYKPKDIVSGDFYFFAQKNNHILLAAVDCTGHGVPGAFMSMIGSNQLQQIINEKAITRPSEILTQLNKGIKIALRQSEQNSQKDGMDLALVSFNPDCRNSENYQLEFAGAYRPLYHISEGKLNEVKSDKTAIGGITDENYAFGNKQIPLKKNDVVYICSDGYSDQFGGPDEKKFMTKRFKELILTIQDKNMSEQKEILEKTIENWKGDLEQMDDILVIGIKF